MLINLSKDMGNSRIRKSLCGLIALASFSLASCNDKIRTESNSYPAYLVNTKLAKPVIDYETKDKKIEHLLLFQKKKGWN